MNITVTAHLLLSIGLIAALAIFRSQAMGLIAVRIGLILLLACGLIFSAFGFLAAGELDPSLMAWVWRAIYMGLVIFSLIGLVRTARFRKAKGVGSISGRV